MSELNSRETSDARVTIVVPAFDEAKRLETSLPAIASYLATKDYPSEIIVVDDGSVDGTSLVVRRISPDLAVPVRLIRYATNRGKGFALKVGFAEAVGKFVLFCDADLSTPIGDADRLLEQLEAGHDVVVASRKMAGSTIEVHQPWMRESMGRIFTAIVRKAFVDVSDITCGFKGFGSVAGKDLFARARIDDWSFDAEVLTLADRRGYRIREVPVRWTDHQDTKVRVLRDALGSLWGLMKIRWNLLMRAYESEFAISEECEQWRSPPHLEPDQRVGQ